MIQPQPTASRSPMTNGDESEGEEEILETWQTTKAGTVVIYNAANESRLMAPMTVARSAAGTVASSPSTPGTPVSVTSSVSSAFPSTVSATSTATQAVVSVPPSNGGSSGTSVPSTSSPHAGAPASADSASIMTTEPPSEPIIMAWFLGGNHSVQLLTSVDGDFDPLLLSSLATVPAVVGELALSVESLVSDDCTVGDFAQDILAKIAENTIAAKRASLALSHQQRQHQGVPLVANSGITIASHPALAASAAAPVQQQQQQQLQYQNQQLLSVPNPLMGPYKPVPNPLARITPPSSPVTTTFASVGGSVGSTSSVPSPGNKRKEAPTLGQAQVHKVARRESASPIIAAR